MFGRNKELEQKLEKVADHLLKGIEAKDDSMSSEVEARATQLFIQWRDQFVRDIISDFQSFLEDRGDDIEE